MSTFDGPNLIVTLDAPTGGVLTLNWQDFYEEWLVWLSSNWTNRGFPAMFTEDFGGNPLTTGILAGAYYVFNNDLGWRLRPAEADHTIYAVGNIPPASDSLPIMTPTLGGYTVFADGLQPITQNVDAIINLQEKQITDLKDRVEALNQVGSATGDQYFWNSDSGDDTKDGTTRANAVKTYSVAEALITDNNNDVLVCLAAEYDGTIATAKQFHLRGSGTDFHINPTTQTGHSLSINNDRFTFSKIRASSTTGYRAIHFNADNIVGSEFEIRGGADGLLNEGSHNAIKDFKIHGTAGTGIHIQGPMTHMRMEGLYHICSHAGYAIYSDPDVGSQGIEMFGEGNIQNNTLGGIWIGSGNNLFTVGANIKPHDNGSTDADNVINNGTNTYNHHEIEEGHTADAVAERVYEGSYTLEQMVRIIASGIAAKASGLDTNTPQYRDLADTKVRIDAVTDEYGNRSSVALDGS